MFETFIIQPIFNMLLILHTVVGDFGVAIILFTVLIRLLMWPLLRKQLHHGRIMRKLQPEIKAIRKKHKTNSQMQSQALMDLYKKHGINPLGSFGLLFIQLPVFIGLFSALRSIINNPERIIHLPYNFVGRNESVKQMAQSVADKANEAISGLDSPELVQRLADQFGGMVTPDALSNLSNDQLRQLFSEDLLVDLGNGAEALVQGPFFNQELFGFIDLSGQAISDGAIYIPVMIIAVLAGVFQFYQTKQLIPKDNKDSKTVREIMREAAKEGREPEQSEISAAMNKRIGLFFAPLITLISATSPSGLALYFASSGLVGLIQQRRVLGEDLEEMEIIADVSESKKTNPKTPSKNNSKKKSASKGKKSSKNKRGR